MSETTTSVVAPEAAHSPTVYFIDDSATMREVIKIAFRKENIHVVACHDAASAIAQMEQTAPDVVISDVIMPDKDGYEVCQHIKQHSQLGRTPVILMSGVVNRTVADKALAVKADELIRKPFLPQELIARVKNLLKPPASATSTQAASSGPAAASDAARTWNNLFGATPAPAGRPSAASVAVPSAPAGPRPAAQPTISHADAPSSAAVQKLRVEIQRLEQLVKKLRSELEAERQYSRSLEENLRTLQETNG